MGVVAVVFLVAIRALKVDGELAPNGPVTGRPTKEERTGWAVEVPPFREFALLAVSVGIAFIGLFYVGTGSSGLTSTREWGVWCSAAALGIGLGVMLAYRAVLALGQLPALCDLGIRRRLRYLGGAFVVLVVVFLFLGTLTTSGRDWPTDMHMPVRLFVVSISVAATAIPWLALVFAVHRGLSTWRGRLSACSVDEVASETALGAYLQLLDVLTASLMAFGVYISVALIPTGALRSLWLAYADSVGCNESESCEGRPSTSQVADQFPASDILLYGGFFAIVLGGVTVPVLAAWRATGRMVVDESFPLRQASEVDGKWVEGRKALEAVLHLDMGLLRNPLTVFSVFAPLITSLLAAFIPELGQT